MSRAVEHTDQLAGQMKRAADALVSHPFRVWDGPSAQRVKGCGPAMARVRGWAGRWLAGWLGQLVWPPCAAVLLHRFMPVLHSRAQACSLLSTCCTLLGHCTPCLCGQVLVDNLWRLYPAEPPEEEELEEVARQEAALKAAAVRGRWAERLSWRAGRLAAWHSAMSSKRLAKLARLLRPAASPSPAGSAAQAQEAGGGGRRSWRHGCPCIWSSSDYRRAGGPSGSR